MEKFAPNAREFVQAFIDSKGPFGELKDSVQHNISRTSLGSFKASTDSIMPTLCDGMGEIGTGWNQVISEIFTSIGSDSSKGLIDRIRRYR